MATTVSTATKLKTITVAEFAKANNFTQIAPEVRANKNGYPFVTFINSKNEAENVYFSKAASKGVSSGDTVTRAMLKELAVAETTNADGEKRMKLVSSNRLELEDLLVD